MYVGVSDTPRGTTWISMPRSKHITTNLSTIEKAYSCAPSFSSVFNDAVSIFHHVGGLFMINCNQAAKSEPNKSYSSSSTLGKWQRISNKPSAIRQAYVSLAIARHLFLMEAKESNLVYSPTSLHVAVSMIAAGAEGRALEELLSFLKSKSKDDVNMLCSELGSSVFTDGSPIGGPKLSIANGIWIQQDFSIRPSFKQVLDHYYNVATNHVDFVRKGEEAVLAVNSWAEKETNGLIKQVLDRDSIDDHTRLILANALYFKGTWTQKFGILNTRDYDFHCLDGNSVKVPFMTSRARQFIRKFDGFNVLRLPYSQGEDKRQFSMYIILPEAKDGLAALIYKVGLEDGFLNSQLDRILEVDVNEFRIPRFKVAFGFEASTILKEMGVSTIFNSNGGLNAMADPSLNDKLRVKSIFQKSFIEVNEEGTEAASVTTGTMQLTCLRPRVDFVADHPFTFVIMEDLTRALLFVGYVLNPGSN